MAGQVPTRGTTARAIMRTAAFLAGVDDVRNGLTLSPTYHRAYDHGLIYLDESYFMRINPEKEAALVASHLDGGLAGFIASLGKIHLPQDRRQWPEVAFIRRANQHRRIPA